jgi:hypothetical protein
MMIYELDDIEKRALLDTVIDRARADLNDGQPLTEMSPCAPTLLDSDCVSIKPFIPMCTECDELPATKVVMLDALNNGMNVNFGSEMCAECANEAADRLRESLPAPALKAAGVEEK